MMNQIIKRDDLYNFDFFTDKAFHKDQVITYIIDLYMDYHEYYNDEHVVSAGRLANAGIHLFKLGVFGRIYKLGESYGSPFAEDMSEFIHDLGDELNGDLIKMVEKYDEMCSMFSMDRDHMKMFQQDISKALEMRNIFYMNSEIPYGTLLYFMKEHQAHPFSNEVKNKLFRNVPIKEVW